MRGRSTSITIFFGGALEIDAQGSTRLHIWRERERARDRQAGRRRGGAILTFRCPFAPSPGDAFTVAAGCDHTQATCQGTFNNLPNFRGFPYVSPRSWPTEGKLA